MEIFQIWRLPCFSYWLAIGWEDLVFVIQVELCDVDFTSSQAGATVISDAVRGFAEFDWSEYLGMARVQAVSFSHHQRVHSWYNDRLH